MFPIKTLVSERRTANLLRQVRWRDGIYCPRCRAESVTRYGSYRVFQRYRCENCDSTFNDQTATVFEHSAIALKKWFLAVYTYIRFNTSLRQLDVEIDVSYKTIYRRVQRFLRALDAPLPHLEGQNHAVPQSVSASSPRLPKTRRKSSENHPRRCTRTHQQSPTQERLSYIGIINNECSWIAVRSWIARPRYTAQ